MADRKPLVLVNGEIEQLTVSDRLVDDENNPYAKFTSFTNGESVDIEEGEACYIFSSGVVKKAKADNVVTTQVAFFAEKLIPPTEVGFFRSYGNIPHTLVAAGGGTKLYLSATTAGRLTSTAPSTSGQFVVECGKVTITASEFEINIRRPIKLA